MPRSAGWLLIALLDDGRSHLGSIDIQKRGTVHRLSDKIPPSPLFPRFRLACTHVDLIVTALERQLSSLIQMQGALYHTTATCSSLLLICRHLLLPPTLSGCYSTPVSRARPPPSRPPHFPGPAPYQLRELPLHGPHGGVLDVECGWLCGRSALQLRNGGLSEAGQCLSALQLQQLVN